MAHFYGTVTGQARTSGTRRGSKKAGLRTVAASWNGAVETVLTHENGRDVAEVRLIPWHGKGVSRVLYRGVVDPVEVKQPLNLTLTHRHSRRAAVAA